MSALPWDGSRLHSRSLGTRTAHPARVLRQTTRVVRASPYRPTLPPHPTAPLPPQIPPEWHGWMIYAHDIPGNQVNAKFAQPFREPWRMNPTFLRKQFGHEEGFHKPPGQWGKVNVARGRIGPKYASWDPNGTAASAEPATLRNYADNSKRLDIE